MKQALLFFALLLMPLLIGAQTINNFDEASPDTNYWAFFDNHGGKHYQTNGGAASDKGWLILTHVNDPVFEGTGALKIEYSVHNTESWGGYTKLEHWHPDPTKVYDWSKYDSVAFWYYNAVPQNLPGRITFRFNLHDVSNSPDGANTYDVGQCEYYYSFEKILDDAPGWNRFALPLTANPDAWNGEAFNRTGWAGIEGNNQLDPDKIKGFSLEFSISGSGEGDVGFGTIIIDHLTLFSPARKAFIFFNGKDFPAGFSGWAWGQSAHEVVVGAGTIPGTNAIKWTQGNEWGNGWTGIGWSISPAYDLSNVWESDSLKLKVKAEEGVGPIRVQLEDGAAKVGVVFQPATDGAFHQYAFKLSEMEYKDGTSNFNPANVVVLGIMAEGSGIAGKVLYITDIWTGTPIIDVVAPEAPKNLQAFKGTYFNLVTWEDVPGETKETYTVYASESPITDVDAPGVLMLGDKIPRGTQSVTHHLVYPLKDAEVTFYYAIVCKDDFSNVSPLATFGPFTNVAKGIATIALKSPNFVADGDVKEFVEAGIKPFTLKASESHWSLGSFDNDQDLTADVYLAVDDSFLYVGCDVIDNIYSFDPVGNFWEDDMIELYLGLYNLTKVHNGFKRGEEPDYKFLLLSGGLDLDVSGVTRLFSSPSENYIFQDFGASDYVIEAKIPLDRLLTGVGAGDKRFHPQNGMKIIMDICIHDSDSKNVRDGVLSFSEIAKDNSWQGPQNWGFSWIGDTTAVVGVKEKPLVNPETYSLSQNYPNPFNPTTTITYTIPVSGKVTIEIFNVLGQKMATVVDAVKAAGTHTVDISANDLPSGIYMYRMKAGSFMQTRKMVLMR